MKRIIIYACLFVFIGLIYFSLIHPRDNFVEYNQEEIRIIFFVEGLKSFIQEYHSVHQKPPSTYGDLINEFPDVEIFQKKSFLSEANVRIILLDENQVQIKVLDSKHNEFSFNYTVNAHLTTDK